VRRRTAGALAALLFPVALDALAQAAPPPTPPPAATPRAKKPSGAKAKPAAPLDFSGVWVLDGNASKGVSTNMEGAVLSVRQNGNHIWIEPIERKEPLLLSEEIVVDGRKYEKGLGPAKGRKGTLTADWGKDRDSLWLQIEAAGDDGEPVGYQRAIWRLRDKGTVWTRQTRTITKGDVKDSYLVFRRREAKPAKP
jgi:hypothetical protein